MTACLKKRVFSFLIERLERSSKRKTKAQIGKEQDAAGDDEKICNFESGIRFDSIDTELGQELIMTHTHKLNEYDVFDADLYMMKQGLSERSAAMVRMRLEGYTYPEIGQQFDLKETRSRELIKESAKILDIDHKLLK